MNALGIDVGGTMTRVALVNEKGRILATRFRSTPIDERGDDLISCLIDSAVEVVRHVYAEPGCEFDDDASWIHRTTAPSAFEAVGLALPGLIDPERGALRRSINLPFLEGRPIVAELTRALNRTVRLITDADAATWGEYAAIAFDDSSTPANPGTRRAEELIRVQEQSRDREGAVFTRPLPYGRGSETTSHAPAPSRPRRFVHLRFGTGIACALVVQGSLQPIEENRHGHLEALVIDRTNAAIACPCGKRGCLETVASGRTLLDRARTLGFHGLTEWEDRCAQRDRPALSALAEIANAIHAGIENLVRIAAPDVVCIGGGVLTALPNLFDAVIRTRMMSVKNATENPSEPRASARAEMQESTLWRASNSEDEHVTRIRPLVEPAGLGDDAGVIGAALLALADCG